MEEGEPVAVAQPTVFLPMAARLILFLQFRHFPFGV